MNKIGLVLIGPKRVAIAERSKVISHLNDIIKTLTYYHNIESTKEIDSLFISCVGANSYMLYQCKSLGLITKNLAMSNTNVDDSFIDLQIYNYEHVYILALWDGVDELVKRQVVSANKFGFQPRIRIIRRWGYGEKNFV